MKRLQPVEWIAFISSAAAAVTFSLGAWLGSTSGLEIMLDLAGFLRDAPPGQDTSRQQAIFLLLLGLALLLLAQLLAVGGWLLRKRPGGERVFHAALMVTGIAAVVLLLILYTGYEARTRGVVTTVLPVFLTAISSGIALRRDFVPPAGTIAAAVSMATTPPADEIEAAGSGSMEKLDFQKQVTRDFRRAKDAQQPFHLAMLGIGSFAEYSSTFGEETAAELLSTLAHYASRPEQITAATEFSTGSVMFAMPGITRAAAEAVLDTIRKQVKSHGVVGEMLLPQGELNLPGHIATYPDECDNLASLTECVLLGFTAKNSG
jgi:GGDEF domain-containing protein